MMKMAFSISASPSPSLPLILFPSLCLSLSLSFPQSFSVRPAETNKNGVCSRSGNRTDTCQPQSLNDPFDWCVQSFSVRPAVQWVITGHLFLLCSMAFFTLTRLKFFSLYEIVAGETEGVRSAPHTPQA